MTAEPSPQEGSELADIEEPAPAPDDGQDDLKRKFRDALARKRACRRTRPPSLRTPARRRSAGARPGRESAVV